MGISTILNSNKTRKSWSMSILSNLQSKLYTKATKVSIQTTQNTELERVIVPQNLHDRPSDTQNQAQGTYE